MLQFDSLSINIWLCIVALIPIVLGFILCKNNKEISRTTKIWWFIYILLTSYNGLIVYIAVTHTLKDMRKRDDGGQTGKTD